MDGHSAGGRRRSADRDADAGLVRAGLLHGRACRDREGLCRLRRHRDRQGALPRRARAGAPGGGGSDPGEERLPRDDEPRDPDTDERRDRDDRPAARHRADAGAAGARRGRPLERRCAPPRHRRYPRLLEDRGRQTRAGARAVRSARVRRGSARHRRSACLGKGRRARLPRRRRGAGRDRGRRHAPSTGAPEPALERREVHGEGRGNRSCRRGAGRQRTASPALRRPGHRHRDSEGSDRPALRIVQPGRRIDLAPLRRHGAWPCDLETHRRADGRNDVGRQRGGKGLDVPHRVDCLRGEGA